MLTSEEKTRLQAFIDRSPEGTPFRRRARLLLLAADGLPPERSANLVGVTIPVARHFLNAFKKQGTALFPDAVWQDPPGVDLDAPLGEALRRLLLPRVQTLVLAANGADPEDSGADLLAIARQLAAADEFLAGPEPAFFMVPFASPRRKLYRRLRRAARAQAMAELCRSDRPEAVEPAAAAAILNHWQTIAAARQQQATAYLTRKKTRQWLAQLAVWCETPLAVGPNPLRLRLALPAAVYQLLIPVRQGGAALPDNGAGAVNREMSYVTARLLDGLTLLAPLLGPSGTALTAPLTGLQRSLDKYGQRRWALKRLGRTPADAADLDHYRRMWQVLLAIELTGVKNAWAEFDRPEWREQLAEIIGSL